MKLLGLHHVTAVTAQVARNKSFYTETLGLRLVKKSVNQDDLTAYHLFYADGKATPGTDLTFFDWDMPREQRGTHSIVRTGLRVGSVDSLNWWEENFRELNVSHQRIAERNGVAVLDFEDPEGQRLTLFHDGGKGEVNPWKKSPVPLPHQIRGLGPVTISVPDLAPTRDFLTRVLGMEESGSYPGENGDVHVFMTADGGRSDLARELHVAVEPHLSPARLGAGGVHHVAFRTPNFAEYEAWLEHFAMHRVATSGPVDRYYFRSIYLREPNGILFEIATDGPGFTADEPMEHLGENLALPPFLEHRRREIEAGLKPLDDVALA